MKGKRALYGLGFSFLSYIFFSDKKQTLGNKGINQHGFGYISASLEEDMKFKSNLENKAKVMKDRLENIKAQMNDINKELNR